MSRRYLKAEDFNVPPEQLENEIIAEVTRIGAEAFEDYVLNEASVEELRWLFGWTDDHGRTPP